MKRLAAMLQIERGRRKEGFLLYNQIAPFYWQDPEFQLEFLEYSIAKHENKAVLPLIEQLCQMDLENSDKQKIEQMLEKYPHALFLKLFSATLNKSDRFSLLNQNNLNHQEKPILDDLNKLLDELLDAEDIEQIIQKHKNYINPQFIQFIRSKAEELQVYGNKELYEGLTFLANYLEENLIQI